mgnify:CR=1 FL=1
MYSSLVRRASSGIPDFKIALRYFVLCLCILANILISWVFFRTGIKPEPSARQTGTLQDETGRPENQFITLLQIKATIGYVRKVLFKTVKTQISFNTTMKLLVLKNIYCLVFQLIALWIFCYILFKKKSSSLKDFYWILYKISLP